jgi:GH25 family lysozyme M1 (1,4-beta-N-acetylmuramidase)
VSKRGSFVAARRFQALATVACFTVLALLVGGAPTAAADGPFGIDVSHHNGAPDWDAAMADGLRFAIAKATEGQTFVDDLYATNMAQADARALPFTAYHFARPDTTADDATLEADHFVDAAALKGKHLLPVLDLESSGGMGARKLRRWAKTWLARVRARLGVKAIIYTTPSFWNEHMGNSRWFADNGYRLWIAHWHVDAPRVPASNWGGRGWTLWQYDNCGSVAGLDGCVDLDRYAGSAISALRIKNNR